jgi:probable F420-dependent oxidoreductase
VRYGVILPNFGPQASVEELVATARQAERLGYHSVWTTDHLILPRADSEVYGRIFEALMTLAYLAAATEHIRLGVSSLVLPQRDPVLAAKQVAALDCLSGGRAMLCVGVGWSAGEYANLGQRFPDRGRRLDEAIQLLRLLWGTGDPAGLTFAGEFFSLREAAFAPLPVQGSGLPIWIGGNSPAAIRRAAQLGDGWHPTRLPVTDFGRGVDRLRTHTAGRPVTVSLRLRVARDAADSPGALTGSPARMTDQLRSYTRAGLEYALLAFEAPQPAARMEAMARFMDEIASGIPASPGP